jgi:hypothetical protein
MTQLVKIAIILAIIELESSFCVHLKACKKQFPMRHDMPMSKVIKIGVDCELL